MERSRIIAAAALFLTAAGTPGALAKEAVLTRSYDNFRTGANTRENLVDPGCVVSRGLRKTLSCSWKAMIPRRGAAPLCTRRSDGRRQQT